MMGNLEKFQDTWAAYSKEYEAIQDDLNANDSHLRREMDTCRSNAQMAHNRMRFIITAALDGANK